MPTDRDFRFRLGPAFQPLLLPAIAFAAGIAAPRVAPAPAAACALALLAAAGWLRARARRPGAALALCLAGIALLGAAHASRTEREAAGRPLARLVDAGGLAPGDRLVVEGWLEGPVVVGPGRARCVLRLERLERAGDPAGAMDLAGETARAALSVRLGGPADERALAALGLRHGSRVQADAGVGDDLALRNPGSETLRARLRREGVDLVLRAAVASLAPLPGARGSRALAALYDARERGLAAIDASFEARTGGVLRALLLGDGSRLDRDVAARFRDAGVFHVLVVSGAHVALVAAVLLWPLAKLTRSPAARLAGGAVPVWAYTLALGAPAPAVRASLALTVALGAPLVARRAAPANTLAAAAFAALAADPGALRDPSFQLTVAAVAAIVLLAAPPLAGLADVGSWSPRRGAPYPPRCPRWVAAAAAALHWDERRSPARGRGRALRFRPDVPGAARRLSSLRLQRPLRFCAEGLWVTAVAQAALAPVSVAHFHRLAAAALLATLPVEAALALALVVGFVFLGAYAVSPALARPLVPALEALVRFADWSAGALAPSGPAPRRVPSPVGWRAAVPWLLAGVLAGLAVAAARWRPVPATLGALVARRRAGPLAAAALATAGAALVALLARPPERPAGDGRLHVLFLDVGQGDAALVRFPDGRTMLVDAGWGPRPAPALGLEDGEPVLGESFDAGERVVCETLLALGVSAVDIAVATHGDGDHAGGYGAVLHLLRVGRALVPRGGPRERAAAAVFEAAGVPVTAPRAGDAFDVAGVRVETLWPPGPTAGGNEGSLVLRLVYGRRAVLLTGDVEGDAERALARSGRELAADVLKVPHHGSRGASSAELLAAVSPAWAVVPAPRLSPHGHPHREALARLLASGAAVLQTGVHGAVEVVTDGDALDVAWAAGP